ncbi:MAG: DUF4339 domain-containing protein [Nitrospira sp.]|nr:DUF4339 domain-containing protein [Nitrospira sp.]
MSEEWYYTTGGQQGGPVSTAQLKQLASSGQLSQTDTVWKQGMADWVPAGKLKGLFVATNPYTPPPSPPAPPPKQGDATVNSPNMKKQVTAISILQSSKLITALYVIVGIVYTLIGIPMILFGGKDMKIVGIIYLAGPILSGIFGFISFAIFAAIYNVLARWLGGIEVVVSDVNSK